MHCKYSTTSPKPNAQVACCMVELEVVFILPHRVTFCLRDRWSLARRVHVARPRRRLRRTIALTTLPGCSWRVRPSDRIGRKHTTWRPIVSGGNPRGPQGYGKYPACTSSTGEVRPERGKIDGKWEVTSLILPAEVYTVQLRYS